MYARGACGTLLVGRLCTGGKTGKNVLEFFRRGTFRRFAPQLLNHGSQGFGVVLLCNQDFAHIAGNVETHAFQFEEFDGAGSGHLVEQRPAQDRNGTTVVVGCIVIQQERLGPEKRTRGDNCRNDYKHADFCRGKPSRPGSATVNVVPSPGLLATDTVPPWASTRRLTMVRPRPAPPVTRFLLGSAL